MRNVPENTFLGKRNLVQVTVHIQPPHHPANLQTASARDRKEEPVPHQQEAKSIFQQVGHLGLAGLTQKPQSHGAHCHPMGHCHLIPSQPLNKRTGTLALHCCPSASGSNKQKTGWLLCNHRTDISHMHVPAACMYLEHVCTYACPLEHAKKRKFFEMR